MQIVKANAEYLDTRGKTPYEFMERIGRVCYKSEDSITKDSAKKFVKMLAKNDHTAMLEHSHIYIVGTAYHIGLMADYINKLKVTTNHTELNYFNITVSDIGIISAPFRSFILMQKYYNPMFYGELYARYKEVFIPQDLYEMDNVHALDRNEFVEWVNTYVADAEMRCKIFTKHLTHTVLFTCDRGVSHELVRHRPCSFAQESTRYCLAGTTKIKTSNPHNKFTIEDLYNKVQNSKNGSYKRIKIKQLNEDDGTFQFAHIKNIFYNGTQKVYKITTELGYELICTNNHQIYTSDGYVPLKELKIGDTIYVNGKTVVGAELYKDYDWLYHQNITLDKTFVQIAKEIGCNASTIKKWAYKLKLPHKGTGYFNVGKTPWNKGLTESTDVRVKKQAEALRTYHCDGRHDGEVLILKEDTSSYYKYKKNYCECCNSNIDLEVHHKDKNHNNNNPNNLMTVCSKCHQRIHNQSLEIPYLDKIIDIQYIGEQNVYDIEMDSKYHNFIADGIVVHNCNYSNNKFNNEITVIKPCFWDEDSNQYKAWTKFCEHSEKIYFELLNCNSTYPQEARNVLPTSVKTEIVVTATEQEWQHILNLRLHGTTGAPHPQMIEIMELAYESLREQSENRLK